MPGSVWQVQQHWVPGFATTVTPRFPAASDVTDNLVFGTQLPTSGLVSVAWNTSSIRDLSRQDHGDDASCDLRINRREPRRFEDADDPRDDTDQTREEGSDGPGNVGLGCDEPEKHARRQIPLSRHSAPLRDVS
jgi:hypothetical protein